MVVGADAILLRRKASHSATRTLRFEGAHIPSTGTSISRTWWTLPREILVFVHDTSPIFLVIKRFGDVFLETLFPMWVG